VTAVTGVSLIHRGHYPALARPTTIPMKPIFQVVEPNKAMYYIAYRKEKADNKWLS
jgi:hypothetical protein